MGKLERGFVGADRAAGTLAPRKTGLQAKARLQRSDWVLAGFHALVAQGADAIRVEALARDLCATKGSFYWHFRDLRDLHQAMLEAWAQLATTNITTSARVAGLTAQAQVLLLADKLATLPEAELGLPPLEPAMRDWGRTDPMARAVLVRVDQIRLADLRALLMDAGLGDAAADRGALTFYAAVIGLESLRHTGGFAMRAPLRALAEAILAPVDGRAPAMLAATG